jgi:tetratricopeptide (TPR) repeat protein
MLSNLLKSLLGSSGQRRQTRRAKELFESGLALQKSRDFESALSCFEEVLRHDPDYAAAHHWLGVIFARDASRYADAARHIERALAIDPTIPDGWMDLGTVHCFRRDFHKAATCFRTALATAPDSAIAHANLGIVLKETGRLEEALDHLRRAHALAPEAEGNLRNLVVALVECDRCEEALATAVAAVERNPASYEARLFYGFARQKLHQPEEALASYAIALEIRTGDAEFHNNRGVALQDIGCLSDALEDYERALALQPDFPLAAFHRALVLLLLGDFGRGWEGYEARRLNPEYRALSSGIAEWEGSSLAGRSIRVYSEQGLGDEIMFASMLPEVIAAAESCIIECSAKLLPIFTRSFPKATVRATAGDETSPACPVQTDCEIPAGSLPRFLRRDVRQFPRHHGYLKADPGRVNCWTQRVAQLGDGLKVGISWVGGVRKTRRPVRSLPLDRWGPIFQVPGVRFVSLQYTPGAAQEVAEFGLQHGIEIAHWAEAIEDYEETAALVCALDLVVSVCTAVIHLGGALGQRVWIMAPFTPEWRYGVRGDTMPWYPSVSLFRQPVYGEWEPVVSAVAAKLRSLVECPGEGTG